MNNITPIHIRELDSIRNQFSNYFEEHADETELDRLYHTWIPLLSTYVTHDSIEAAIDDWYALIEHPYIWFHYIEEIQSISTRPIVSDTLEAWKLPFVFAGIRKENHTYRNWSNGSEWSLSDITGDHFIGIALPLPEKNHAVIHHYFEADEDFFNLLEDHFENSSHTSRQLYLNRMYLTCLAHLSD
ncbi:MULTISPECIES: hypothetical protein [Bacillaceae]|uniref:Uncharacterized protein n=1 Tax=Domibacillus aminovorans TaxID=29332 RepID=A0A177KLR5_9BACI|nr:MULTISPECIES: hypothetical protein [Bacillaceae]OAH54350.1 hypothetical protein AWH48_07035 [Domibacillus aminovorans]